MSDKSKGSVRAGRPDADKGKHLQAAALEQHCDT